MDNPFSNFLVSPKVSGQNPDFQIGDPSFSLACNEMLDIFASGDLFILTTILTDDVVMFFPEGLDSLRINISGRANLLSYWVAWREDNHFDLVTIDEVNSVPVDVLETPNYIGLPGNWVFSWFDLKIRRRQEVAGARVNATFHFNDQNLIDHIYTYYDSDQFIFS
jgi:hypothetical protein